MGVMTFLMLLPSDDFEYGTGDFIECWGTWTASDAHQLQIINRWIC